MAHCSSLRSSRSGLEPKPEEPQSHCLHPQGVNNTTRITVSRSTIMRTSLPAPQDKIVVCVKLCGPGNRVWRLTRKMSFMKARYSRARHMSCPCREIWLDFPVVIKVRASSWLQQTHRHERNWGSLDGHKANRSCYAPRGRSWSFWAFLRFLRVHSQSHDSQPDTQGSSCSQHFGQAASRQMGRPSCWRVHWDPLCFLGVFVQTGLPKANPKLPQVKQENVCFLFT